MKKIKLSTIPYIYKVKNVKVLRINILYPVKIKSRYTDVYKLNLMNRMLSSFNKKYNEINIFLKELKKNLIIKYDVGFNRYDNELFITVNFVIPKEGIVDNYSLEKSFEFLHDLLYNPDASNGEFSEKNFSWNKNVALNNLKREINNIYDLSIEEIDNFFDPNNEYFIHRKERIDLVEKTNAKNVYDYYEKNIKNNKYITFITGAIDDEKKVLELYNKYFYQEEYHFDIEVDLHRLIPYKDYQEKRINTKYNQSVIYQIYQVKNIKEKDLNIMKMLYYFLYSKENNLIFSVLRTEYNLVYETLVEFDEIHGLIYVRVLMDKKDEKVIKDLINETIYSILDEAVFKKCKDNLMRSLEYDLLDEEDDEFHDVNISINKKLKFNIAIDYIIKEMRKIDYKQMKEFLNRFKISRDLFMEGGHDEENI